MYPAPDQHRFQPGLVEPRHRAQGPGDQVQLVLNDQLRRAIAVASKESRAALLPGQPGELVDGGEQQGRRGLVKGGIDDVAGQSRIHAGAEVADGVGTPEAEVLRPCIVVAPRLEGATAPGTGLQDQKAGGAGALLDGLIHRRLGIRKVIWTRCAADPETEGDGLGPEFRPVPPQQLQGADQAGRPAELVLGQQP